MKKKLTSNLLHLFAFRKRARNGLFLTLRVRGDEEKSFCLLPIARLNR